MTNVRRHKFDEQYGVYLRTAVVVLFFYFAFQVGRQFFAPVDERLVPLFYHNAVLIPLCACIWLGMRSARLPVGYYPMIGWVLCTLTTASSLHLWCFTEDGSYADTCTLILIAAACTFLSIRWFVATCLSAVGLWAYTVMFMIGDPSIFREENFFYAGVAVSCLLFGGRYKLFVEREELLDEAREREQRLSVSLSREQEELAERERAEASLQEARNMLQAVLDTIPQAVSWKDSDGRVLGYNRIFSQMFELGDSDSLVGRSIADSVGDKEYAEKLLEMDRRVFEDREIVLNEMVPMRRGDNEDRWLRVNKVPLRGDSDGVFGLLSTYEDITDVVVAGEERKKLDEQIEHARKLESLGIMAGGIAHDFNNILVGVMGNAELALHEAAPDSPEQDYLSNIILASNRAADLIRQMLAYSGKTKLSKAAVNLNDVISEMPHLVGGSLVPGVELEMDLAEDLPPIYGDGTQIRQVIMNIVVNAAESIEEPPGTIRIRSYRETLPEGEASNVLAKQLSPDDQYVCLEIEDTGKGMGEETQKKIFDPFFTTKFTGRGLGLAAAQGIIQGHSGVIELRSAVGAGTCVRIVFPAAERLPLAIEEREEKVDTMGIHQGTILLVDDEEIVLKVSQTMLESLGYDVLMARDGQEAVDLFKEQSGTIDAVLMDLTMPNMNGEEALREIRAVSADVPVLLCSGYSEQELKRRGIDEVNTGFLNKPFQLDELEARMLSIFSPKEA